MARYPNEIYCDDQQITTGLIVEFDVPGIELPVRGRVVGFRMVNDVVRVAVDTGIGVQLPLKEECRIPLQG